MQQMPKAQIVSPPVQALPRKPEEIPPIFAWFEQMRAHYPVFCDERRFRPIWQVFGYNDITTILKDPARFSSRAFASGDTFLADTLVAKDPPDHRKLRNLVNLAFTPRAVAHLAERVAAITQELLDQVRAKGEMDVTTDLAFPLPARVIAEMLGVPDEDWDIFQRWASVDTMSASQDIKLVQETNGDMHGYFAQLLAERRRSPREDLITALSLAEIDGERLSTHELVSFCMLLLAAGQETTKNLIANFVLTLADHPEDQTRLVQDPALMPTAIEEVLRYLPPVWFVIRQTTTEVELSGVRIPADQTVMLWLASANRDEAQFSQPAQFDIQRDPNRHLSFGHGIHFCVGAPLARLEARIALPMMLEQMKGLHIKTNASIPIRAGIVFIIEHLPVIFQPY